MKNIKPQINPIQKIAAKTQPAILIKTLVPSSRTGIMRNDIPGIKKLTNERINNVLNLFNTKSPLPACFIQLFLNYLNN